MTPTEDDYIRSVMAMADPDTGMLSPGDARRLLASHAMTWDDYVYGESGGWPTGPAAPVTPGTC